MIRIGVDTGGTFTDFVFLENGHIQTLKIPSTPANPSLAILEGLQQYLDKPFELVHGTTVSTNAFLQGKMAKCAFLCTKGFEHILYIGRQNRTGLFSLEAQKPSPLVPLSLCFGIAERTLKDGIVRLAPAREEIEKLCLVLKKKKVEAVGVVFLHSYRNPQNEKFTASILRDHGFHVTASYEIMPEYREYERAVVTVLNSALKPVISHYIANLMNALEPPLPGSPGAEHAADYRDTGRLPAPLAGIKGEPSSPPQTPPKKLYIIQSNGGILSPSRIVEEPIHTIISGPAGGVIAARQIALTKDYPDLITIDMGGTSTDVSVIKNGELTLGREGSIENLPLRLPMIDIATVGAGGGSIARIDSGGVLQVGPESAGADPGPACYGKSELPTVTDAFVVTGGIIPSMFLGGKMKIYPDRSRRVIGKIAEKIGKDLLETAEGIIRISVSSMERALRSVTLEKGEDPRYYTLMPFGGAGGLVAAMLAARLGITRILFPPGQGVFSALGMLVADFKKEIQRSFLQQVQENTGHELDLEFAGMTANAERILAEEGFPREAWDIPRFLEMRYKGQSYELTIPYSTDFIEVFHREHRQLYSYSLADDRCEIVNLRVIAAGKRDTRVLIEKEQKFAQDRGGAAANGKKAGEKKHESGQRVYYNGETRDFHVYLREELERGETLAVPAVIVAADSTVIAPPGFTAGVDEHKNILLTALTAEAKRV